MNRPLAALTIRRARTANAQALGPQLPALGGELVGFASVGPSRDVDLSAAEWLELNTSYLLPQTWEPPWPTGCRRQRSPRNVPISLGVRGQRTRASLLSQGRFRARQLTIAGTTLTEIRFVRMCD